MQQCMQQPVQATITLTDKREIHFEMYPDVAPLTVRNFVDLIERRFFDGLCFHRVIPSFMIQGGGFVHGKMLVPKEGARTIRGEFLQNGVRNDLRHTPGVFSMARTSAPDSASGQFFICVAHTPFLDGQYAAFGKVTDESSLAVAVSISTVPTHSIGYYDDVPVTPVVIESIRLRSNA